MSPRALLTEAATPESQGLSSMALSAALDRILDESIAVDSVLVARHGKVVVDTYKFPYRGDVRRDMRSVTKSMTALVTGAVLADLPDYGMSQPLTSNGDLTVGQVLSMTAGLACGIAPDEAPQINAMSRSSDWTKFVQAIPRIEPAGFRFRYCTPGYQLVSDFVARATGRSLAENAQRILFEPLGITDWHWRADPLGCTVAGMALLLRPRDMAKIGQLMLEGGRCGDRQLIPQGWIEAVTLERVKTGRAQEGYSYGFWLPPDRPGVYEMQGRGGQQVSNWPAKDLMIVVTGSGYPDEAFAPLFKDLLVSDEPIGESGAATGALARAVGRFEAPPAATAPSRPGPVAEAMLGKTFHINDPGLIGLRGVSLTQNGREGELVFTASEGRVMRFPLSFDSVPRLAFEDSPRSPIAGTALWDGPDHVRLEVTLFGEAQRLLAGLKFREDGTLRFRMIEASGQFAPVDLVGTSRA